MAVSIASHPFLVLEAGQRPFSCRRGGQALAM